MPTLPKTPARASAPSRADGLLVQLAKGGSKAHSINRLNAAVAHALKGEWQAGLINHKDRLYELIRTNPDCQPTCRQAFDMVRSLQANEDIAVAEVGAIVPGVDPDLNQVYPGSQIKAVAKGFGSDEDKPCSQIEEWALSETQVQAAWSLPLPVGGKRQGKGIVIAHPDTGYTKHPEFFDAARVMAARGYDFEDDESDPLDPLKGQAPGHGTATGSVVMGAAGDQSPQLSNFVTGVAPRSGIIPIRVSTSVVHLSFRRLVLGIYRAVEENAHVISMSLGGPFYSPTLETAINSALERGIIVIAAAGNVWPYVVYPAKFHKVIAMAASDCGSKPWRKSARGRSVDVTAPGESVWRAKVSRSGSRPFSNSRSSGTSYATALTAGACALWLAYHGRSRLVRKYGKENLYAVFRHVLRATAEVPRGWKKSRYGAGIINVRRLLDAKLPAKSTVLAAAPKAKTLSTVASVTELLPEISTAKAKTVLAKTWKCKPGELEAELAPYEHEFRYLLVTNPDLRAAILRNARAKSLRGISARTLARPDMIGKRASPGLSRRLGVQA
jgi:thermitase